MLPSLKINTWSEQSLSNLAKIILNITPKPFILIDGAAGSGKTTLSEKLAHILNANLVHTDDVSWCADPINWDAEITAGIINPWQKGDAVSYKPTGWVKENRPGSIKADPNKPLIIEGMSASRKTLRTAATFSVWVDTEPRLARERVIQKDLAKGENGGTVKSIVEFAEWWDSIVEPLYLAEEPWKHVDVIVSGSLSDLTSGNLMIHTPATIYTPVK